MKKNKSLFEDDEEKEGLAKVRLLLECFNDIEYQIDELIAFFFGRKDHMDAFIEIITPKLNFGAKFGILKKILLLGEIKKISKLGNSDLKFIDKFQEVRNIIAHGTWLHQDGDMNENIYNSNTKSFDMPNLKKLREIKDRAIDISKKIFLIQKYYWNKKDKIPRIKPSLKEKKISFDI